MLELASGVINVLEKKLLSHQDQERMLKSPNPEKAFDVLFDTDLADFASSDKDLESILKADLARTKKFLSDVLPVKRIFLEFLFLKLKSSFLKKRFKKGEEETKPDTFTSIVLKELEKVPKKEINSLLIEDLVDRMYFKEKLFLAKKIDRFLLEMTKLEIDLANLRRLLKRREDNNNFIEGGNLNKIEVEKIAELKEGEILQDMKRFLEVYGLSLILEKNKVKENPFYLESALQDFFSEKIFNKAKESGAGYEKVMAFFQKKLNVAANIRLIMFSKENKINFEEIIPYLLPI